MGLGLLYLAVSVCYCSDHPLVVLTRRELSAYFYSPLIYLALVGFTGVAWWHYKDFLFYAFHPRILLTEPIMEPYLWGLIPIVTLTFLVPVLTMRLLSEEKRSGSLEVLLTAPVKESTVVLSKFIAAFVLYLILWLPWWIFLIALRIGGGQPFDYRALFSFVIALSVTGTAFVSMGLFFSSLTSNQITAAVLTFALMMFFLAIFFVKSQLRQESPNNPWLAILNHIDYVDMWRQGTMGKLMPRYLLFQLSATSVWLFLTVKVLQARRWA
jgi:ABC-type transport system involved in multi-copper enzyme maturation permease subunit